MATTAKRDDSMDTLSLTVRLTHLEAGVVYAVLQSVLSLGVFDPLKVAPMESVVEKLKAAQTMAVSEGVMAKSAKGEPN